jgi:23S rRNA U2552 (ribose-2'-O)-methylase RlmE/FtsJ
LCNANGGALPKLAQSRQENTKLCALAPLREQIKSILLSAYSVKRKCAVQRIINELAELLQLLKRLWTRIFIVLEIGTAFGGNLYLLSKITGLNINIISIDLPPQIDRLSRHMRKLCFSNELRKNVRRSQNLHLLRSDSHAKETFDEVRDILEGRFVNLLFIDGDKRISEQNRIMRCIHP